LKTNVDFPLQKLPERSLLESGNTVPLEALCLFYSLRNTHVKNFYSYRNRPGICFEVKKHGVFGFFPGKGFLPEKNLKKLIFLTPSIIGIC